MLRDDVAVNQPQTVDATASFSVVAMTSRTNGSRESNATNSAPEAAG